jgi:hypothetical protein
MLLAGIAMFYTTLLLLAHGFQRLTACLVGIDSVVDQQLVFILNVEQSAIADSVCDPNRSAIFRPVIDRAAVGLHAVPEKSDEVSALEGCPHSCTTALPHVLLSFLPWLNS